MSDSEFVTGIDYPSPFDRFVISLCESASRHVCIQSPKLDYAAFDNSDLVDALSALARRSRQAEVRILISDARSIIGRGHRLLQLTRRLPSVVRIRKLADHPQWNNETVVVRDRDGVLYKPGGSDHEAFFEPASRASTLRHLDLFNELWRYSMEDPELRSLHI
jgi:phosphatidylserine/phosphatidylglycerophosphate/cardiolipin synthase-like enzyme